MAKDMSNVVLFDFYGKLLSPRQQEMFDLYYNEDLSLGELAENLGVTRQGVLDNIRTAENKLNVYEEKLGFVAKQKKYSGIIEDIIKMIESEPHTEKTLEKVKMALRSFE